MDGKAARKQEVATIKLNADASYQQRAIQEHNLNLDASPECRKFEVCCHAGNAGHLEVASDAVSVTIGQRIRKGGKEEFWGSLLIECKEQGDGSLVVEVVVFHPDWEEPLRVAHVESNTSLSDKSQPALQCDLEQKRL